MLYVLSKCRNGGNETLQEISAEDKAEAVKVFQEGFPCVELDDTGYAKHGDTTYVVSESRWQCW